MVIPSDRHSNQPRQTEIRASPDPSSVGFPCVVPPASFPLRQFLPCIGFPYRFPCVVFPEPVFPASFPRVVSPASVSPALVSSASVVRAAPEMERGGKSIAWPNSRQRDLTPAPCLPSFVRTGPRAYPVSCIRSEQMYAHNVDRRRISDPGTVLGGALLALQPLANSFLPFNPSNRQRGRSCAA